MDVIVIGGGAAGFFSAIEIARLSPGHRVTILEKSNKVLGKVKVSGGGRCNVTHNCYEPRQLASHYPRGSRMLKNLFREFHAGDMVRWLEERGVEVHAEADGRMFPDTNDSQTIVDCFVREAQRKGVDIRMGESVTRIEDSAGVFRLTTGSGQEYHASKVLIATGGNSNLSAYKFISDLGHSIRKPIPSLFTFNDSAKRFVDLMGLSVKDAVVRIEGTRYSQKGPVLITHWGLSGPAVIKLSAWAAEYLHESAYRFRVYVNWAGDISEIEMRNYLEEHRREKGRQNVITNALFGIPVRLWNKLCILAEIPDGKVWSELSKKSINRLIEFLIRCPFDMAGKTTYKEEFVTCGGVPLDEIDPDRMESKRIKGLFFAGEALDIDGETGGFNFQAAWTTGYLAARAIASDLK
jgi:predicted Rossmann fold flavoprotein